jgi:hypothetical protein
MRRGEEAVEQKSAAWNPEVNPLNHSAKKNLFAGLVRVVDLVSTIPTGVCRFWQTYEVYFGYAGGKKLAVREGFVSLLVGPFLANTQRHII